LKSHYEDVLVRGQNMHDVKITAPYVSLSGSVGMEMEIDSQQDVVMKGSHFARCKVNAADGEVFICAGSIRECTVTAKYDIELTGHVDEFTLKHAKSEKGQVRNDGKPVKASQRKRA
jgi:hypothetical protein